MKKMDKVINRSVGIASILFLFLLLLACLKLMGAFPSLKWSSIVVFSGLSMLFIFVATACHMVMNRHTMLSEARIAFNRLGRLGNDMAEFVEDGGTFRLKDKNFRFDIISQLEAKSSPSASMYLIETSGDRFLLLFSDKVSTLRDSYFKYVNDHWWTCDWGNPSQVYNPDKLVKILRRLYGSVDDGSEVVPDTYFAIINYEKMQPTGHRELTPHAVIFIGAVTGQLLEAEA